MVSTDRIIHIIVDYEAGEGEERNEDEVGGVGEEKWGIYYLNILLKNIDLNHKNKQLSDRRQDYTAI